jgi:hypothetical protein
MSRRFCMLVLRLRMHSVWHQLSIHSEHRVSRDLILPNQPNVTLCTSVTR